MLPQLFQALALPLRLAVADADQGQHRGHIQHGQRVRVLRRDLAGRHQRPEDTGVIGKHPVHIAPGIQGGQLRRAKLLDGHHAAKAADLLIMEGVCKNLPHLLIKRVLGDLRKNRDIPARALHMDVEPAGVRLILRRRGLHNGVKNRLLARKMVIERGSPDAHRLCNFPHADRVIAAGGKKLQGLVQNSLLRVLLLHHRTPLTSIS